MEQKRRERLTDIELTDNALAILKKRYLKKNERGEAIEEPIDMFRRVASNIAEGELCFKEGEEGRRLYEEWSEKFLQLMLDRRFMPNSPTLMNAGRELQQLSACFVLPVEDSIDGIYDTLKHQAIIHKSGGGTGFAFSRLRPKNDIVKSTMGVSSGPVSFMSIYDASTDKIKQGGTRRGANMGILRVDHPDIEEFIECKRDNEKINNFNISVAITDEFMEAVDGDDDFGLVNPRNGEVVRTVRARDLFRKIVEGAWLNGEPGVIFIDRINATNPTPQFPIESTNPCSEAHLPPYDSCNLGSINLERFVRTSSGERASLADGNTAGSTHVDWEDLREAVHTAVRFLDNVIEMNNYPLPEIEQMSKGNRRIGLGVMGFADALIKLGITYDSEEGLAFAERVMKFIDDEAWEASRKLAEERGVFANYEGSLHEARGDRVRNATVTTIAPTGTISIIAGCSGGIEPLFAVAFMRRQADMELPDVNPEFVRLAKERGFYSEELMQKVAEHGSVREIPEVPEDVRRVWVTSHDITPEWHVRMQAAFQKYTSMGISKTINLPNEATPEDVGEAYMLAYKTGCKGIAVYRDGSREAQVLSTGKTEKSSHEPQVKHVSLAEARNGRPRTLSGVTKKVRTGHGPLYVTMNDDEFGPRECFVVLGKPGGTAAAFSDALGRMISLAMTHGATPAEIVHQLRGIQDGHPAGVGPNAVLSVPDGVAKAMAEHYLIEENAVAEESKLPVIGACPECGSGLTRQEGCVVCHSCGYSKCS
ncbi:vitamin B12-dependent ribonucleotide reductase [Rubrobacter taiwanensis]|uniref:Vitamin B12-dependent ribonucleotide reductase n=1 Tax=Rubrobacter taiwanensis TaxID=185139 RepID=A0A4R1BI28_9ACTN|nr:vitamin B12-dependent ribonucleotide reductase [Rubrobacter taiwanensis]TCJ16891.1 vitamin B12-dependent ribonucleotide reductase [Rubrobacter taiwanensis]